MANLDRKLPENGIDKMKMWAKQAVERPPLHPPKARLSGTGRGFQPLSGRPLKHTQHFISSHEFFPTQLNF